ncbi:MAG: MFS transporter [Acidimicrobiales bacterium]
MSLLTPYHRLVTSSGLSNLADGVFQVALPIVTLGVTRDPSAFATVTLALRLPWLFFALPAGALADRLDRRRTMFLVNLGRAALLGVLALLVATGNETLWLLCAAAFTLGIGETLFDTAAQSIMPNVVPADSLSRANARLYAVELTANQFVGPPIGGFIAGVAAAAAIAGSAGAYLVAAMVLALIAGSFRPERAGPPTRIRHDIVEGVRYLYAHRLLRTLAIIVGVSNLASTAALTVLPLYAIDPGPMGLSAAGFGVLLTAGAIGSLGGTFIVPRLERLLGRSRALLVSLVAFTLAEGVPGVTASAPVIFIAYLVGVGLLGIAWNVITVSLRQRIVPDHLLGRVNAGYRLVAWGTMPLGAGLGGVIGELLGLRAVFLLAAAAGLSCVPLLLAVVSDRAIAAAEEAASPVPVGSP